MSEIVAFFLAASLIIYCCTGGADFGAGILEAFLPPSRKIQHRKLVKKAISPVWEANHVWLIIMIVILFVGYPAIYTQISLTFHIPLVLMLVGIIVRGCAFVFRHYSPTDQADSKLYSWAFSLASILTPIFLGTVVGGLVAGFIPPTIGSFSETFIEPWFNPFAVSVGVFTATIFAYLASAYLIDEAEDPETAQCYRQLAVVTQWVMVGMGAVVVLTSTFTAFSLIQQFFAHKLSLACLAIASALVAWGWRNFKTGNQRYLRYLASTQVTLVILAWLWIIMPTMLRYSDGSTFTLANHAGNSSITTLGICLLVGGSVIFPSLAYLLYIFKFQK